MKKVLLGIVIAILCISYYKVTDNETETIIENEVLGKQEEIMQDENVIDVLKEDENTVTETNMIAEESVQTETSSSSKKTNVNSNTNTNQNTSKNEPNVTNSNSAMSSANINASNNTSDKTESWTTDTHYGGEIYDSNGYTGSYWMYGEETDFNDIDMSDWTIK